MIKGLTFISVALFIFALSLTAFAGEKKPGNNKNYPQQRGNKLFCQVKR